MPGLRILKVMPSAICTVMNTVLKTGSRNGKLTSFTSEIMCASAQKALF